MNHKFAKLFETGIGQIVVMRRHGDDGPEVTLFFYPGVELLSVCAVNIGFKDDDEGAEKADKVFEVMTEEKAIKIVSSQIEQLKGAFEGGV